MLAHAAAAEVHDDCLWMKIAEVTGAPGNTSCLVGTPERVAEAIARYYRLGALSHVLLRGFDPLPDAVDFGRELIPRIRQRVAEIDRESASPAAKPTVRPTVQPATKPKLEDAIEEMR